MELKQLLKLTQEELKEVVIKKARERGMEVVEVQGGVIVNPSAKVLLSSHLDLVSDVPPKEVIEQGGILVGLDKRGRRTILGGDDRAGVWIMSQLMGQGLDYAYAFFEDEEKGCVGSQMAIKNFDFSRYNCFVGLDRRGSKDIATYGYDNKGLIRIFEKRGYKQAIGSVTDVAKLSAATGIACVNLSVGFNNEHSPREYIDMKATIRTLEVLSDGELLNELKKNRFEVEDYKYKDSYYYEDFYDFYDFIEEIEENPDALAEVWGFEKVGENLYYDPLTRKYVAWDPVEKEFFPL